MMTLREFIQKFHSNTLHIRLWKDTGDSYEILCDDDVLHGCVKGDSILEGNIPQSKYLDDEVSVRNYTNDTIEVFELLVIGKKGNHTMKIFISQIMKDLTDEEIKERREQIKEICKEKWNDCEFIDSFIEENPGNDVQNVAVWYLGKSLEMMSTADAVVFDTTIMLVKNPSNGVLTELDVATQYDIPRYIIGIDGMKRKGIYELD